MRYLDIALGSGAELETQTEIAFDLKYLNIERKISILEGIDREARMIRSLTGKIAASIQSPTTSNERLKDERKIR